MFIKLKELYGEKTIYINKDKITSVEIAEEKDMRVNYIRIITDQGVTYSISIKSQHTLEAALNIKL